MRAQYYFAVAVVGLLATSGLARPWSDATGKHRTEAELVEQLADKVRLKTPAGKIIEVPLERLSAADREYLRDLGKSAGNAAQSEKKSAAAAQGEATAQGSARLSIGIKTFQELERLATKQQALSTVLQLYKLFLNDPQVSEAEKQLARDRLPYWEDLASGDAVRIGTRWVTGAQLEQMEADEARLIEEAVRMLDVKEFAMAMDRFQRASKANPKGIASEYMMGLIAAIVQRDAGKAEDHFSECVKRRITAPESLSNTDRGDLIASLNNLALAEIRQRKYDSALKHWKTAAKIAPPPPHMVQNVGRLVHLARSSPLLGVPPQAAKAAGDLYADIAVRTKAGRFEQRRGWLYMGLLSDLTPMPGTVKSAADKPASPPAEIPAVVQFKAPGEDDNLVVAAFGSGFAFQPHYFATNHHVVDGADRLTVILPDKPRDQFEAKVVAVSKKHDLAIVRVDGIEGVPLPLADKPARLGSDVMLLGYPVPDLLGPSVKATRGSVTGLAEPGSNDLLIYDAVSNPGNSGGPACDRSGAVLAIHRAGLLKGADPKMSSLAGGVPVNHLVALARENIPTFASAPAGPAKDDWADVAEMAGRSTCLVVVYERVRMVPAPQPLQAGGSSGGQAGGQDFDLAAWKSLQDPWCMLCNGSGMAECPVRNCARGMVSSQRVNVVGSNPVTGQKILESVPTRVPCATCGGRGKVRCRACVSGIDPDVAGSRPSMR